MLSRVHTAGVTLLALALLVALAGCAGDAVNVGEQSSSPGALYPASLECVPGAPFEPDVDWEGYVENGAVEIAAQRVRIRLPQGDVPGFVLFGSGPRLPEATDPNTGWPCSDMAGGYLLPGHPYTIQDAFITDFRMQFRIAAYEPMEGWCALHGESAINPGRPDGKCQEIEYINGPDGSSAIVPASAMCDFCTCDSAGCRAKSAEEPVYAPNDGIYYVFDIGIEGDVADGTVKNLLPDISAAIGHFTERARFQRAD